MSQAARGPENVKAEPRHLDPHLPHDHGRGASPPDSGMLTGKCTRLGPVSWPGVLAAAGALCYSGSCQGRRKQLGEGMQRDRAELGASWPQENLGQRITSFIHSSNIRSPRPPGADHAGETKHTGLGLRNSYFTGRRPVTRKLIWGGGYHGRLPGGSDIRDAFSQRIKERWGGMPNRQARHTQGEARRGSVCEGPQEQRRGPRGSDSTGKAA